MIFRKLLRAADLPAILILILLWIFFFWRVWTPIDADRVSFDEGDFSAQFVAWVDYAVERLDAGEIPLWNPYQYGGAPFQASSQTALTYPPRMVTLALLRLQADVQIQEVYIALQWESMLHVLAASLFLYAFVRLLITEQMPRAQTIPPHNDHHWLAQVINPPPAVLGGMVAAISFAYGGFLAGFPILQVPLLSASVWLPLILLGILLATAPSRPDFDWRWLLFSAVMLGLCLLAGHPQTAWFSILIALAWLGWRIGQRGWGWQVWLQAVIVLGVVSGLLAAVQLLPTAEFTQHTYRTALTFEEKGGGYSFEELSNILFPIRGKIWTSIYFGIVPLLLSGVAIIKGVRGWQLWLGLALGALMLSFGARTPIYGILYVILPGLSLFRGQERAVLVMAYCVAILAGLGIASFATEDERRLRRWLQMLGGLAIGLALVFFILAQTDARTLRLEDRLNAVTITAMIVGFWWWALRHKRVWIVAVLIFDVFSATAMLQQNYQPVLASQRMQEPAFVQTLRDNLAVGDRLDSTDVIRDGYSTVYRLPDIKGSDPLQLESTQFILEQLPPPLRYDLLGVRIVLAEPQGIAATQLFDNPPIWRIDAPRGFAHVVYQVEVSADPRERVARGDLDMRQVVVLEDNVLLPEPTPEDTARVDITTFLPERITIQTELPQKGIVTLALPYYPGWQATVDGNPVTLRRAYGALSAVEVPAGGHTLQLTYQSKWLQRGAVLSGLAWFGIALLMIYWGWRERSAH